MKLCPFEDSQTILLKVFLVIKFILYACFSLPQLYLHRKHCIRLANSDFEKKNKLLSLKLEILSHPCFHLVSETY